MFDDLTTQRFWSKVDRRRADECWLWAASSLAGYGAFRLHGKIRRAHRVAWSIANAREIPSDMLVCHSCDNPLCCNPGHLWLGSSFDNMRDMAKKGRGKNSKKTHCVRGHLLVMGGGITRNGNPRRVCRTCKGARA